MLEMDVVAIEITEEELKIETQNTNAPACRFYARRGCVLRAIRRFAYPLLPNEVELLWYKELLPETGSPGSALHR